MAYIYKHIRKDTNEIFYIGIGTTKYRATTSHGRNPFWHRVVNKTEWESQIIEDGLSWKEACEKEIELIKLYGRTDLKEGALVNLTDGGEGVLGSKSNIGKKRSEETKQYQSYLKKGKKLSAEHIKNISIASKKRWDDEIERAKMLNSMKRGWNHSDESKQKMSESKKGKPTWSKGKTHSDEHRRRNSESKMGKTFKKVECVHCGRFVAISKINLWHNDNCKLKIN